MTLLLIGLALTLVGLAMLGAIVALVVLAGRALDQAEGRQEIPNGP